MNNGLESIEKLQERENTNQTKEESTNQTEQAAQLSAQMFANN